MEKQPLSVDSLYAQVIRGNYKRFRISIQAGNLRMTAPLWMSEKTIREHLTRAQSWIQENLQKTREKLTYQSDMRDGGVVYLYGAPLTLRVDVNADKTDMNPLNPTELIVASPTREAEDIRAAVSVFLKKRFVDLFNERAPQIIAKMPQKPRRIYPSDATKTRWGACNWQNRDIRLSWRVVCLPVHCFDYLLTHELAHLEVPNHSPAFWAIVEKYCPDYMQSRKTMHSTHTMVLV